MYIEFRLPKGSGGSTAAYVSKLIHKELQAWQDRHNITMRVKNIKYSIRVTFDQDQLYSFFGATWNPALSRLFHEYLNFRTISDLNNRQDTKDCV